MIICPGAVTALVVAVLEDLFLAFLPCAGAAAGTHGLASESVAGGGNLVSGTAARSAGTGCACCDGAAAGLDETCVVEPFDGRSESPSLFRPLIRRYKARATIKIRADATA